MNNKKKKKRRDLESARALDHRRAETCYIFDAEYRGQESALTRCTIMCAWVDCSVEVFSERTYAVELTLGDLASQRA